MKGFAWAFALSFFALPAMAAEPAPPPVVVQDMACAGGTPADAVCKHALLPEDYAKPAGRRVGLDIVIVKARHPDAAAPALLVFGGGPGERASQMAVDEAPLWPALLQTHDLVFIDQRGSGTTPDLSCPSEGDSRQAIMKDLWPRDSLARCAHTLAARADLDRYTTTDAARDTDSVRRALGYAKVDLLGYSYGTRLAQDYMRHYGQSVHAALLIGPMAPDLYVPGDMAQVTEASLHWVLNHCKADAACAAAYPDVDRDLSGLMHRLAQGGLILHEAGGDITISSGVIASYLRSQLYTAHAAVLLPQRIHALAESGRDQAQLAAIAKWREGFSAWAPAGMYMAIACAEDVPFVDEDKARRDAAGTLLGSYRLDQQTSACRVWPHTKVDAAFHAPLISDVPTLMLVGEFDPATPSSHGALMASGLTHGRLVVVPNRGHMMLEGWNDCVGGLATAFLKTGDEKAEMKCVAGLRLPPFQLGGKRE